MISLKELSIAFTAGALGALIITLLMWLEVKYGLANSLSINLPNLSGQALVLKIYKMVAWGGIWAFLLLLPLLKSKWFLRGIIFSLAPSIVTFLYFAPKSGIGYFGIDAGYLMPLNILILNAIWGIIAAWWFETYKS